MTLSLVILDRVRMLEAKEIGRLRLLWGQRPPILGPIGRMHRAEIRKKLERVRDLRSRIEAMTPNRQ